MQKQQVRVHLRGRYIKVEYDFDILHDVTVFSVFIEDNELGGLLGNHYHMACPLDQLDKLRWPIFGTCIDETELKGEVMMKIRDHYLNLLTLAAT
jgi:hypothetical protein